MTDVLQSLEYRTGLSHKLCNSYNAATRIREESGLGCQKNLQSAECDSQHLYFTVRARTPGKKSLLINKQLHLLSATLQNIPTNICIREIPINNRIGFVDKSGFIAFALQKRL